MGIVKYDIFIYMYDYIYFDLDDTLIRDNPKTGKSEVLQSGYTKYLELKKEYPRLPFILFTNRLKSEIQYPNIYIFDEVIGKDDMERYIIKNIREVPFIEYLIPKNLYIYLQGLFLYKNSQTPKVLYLFLRHISKGEKVCVEDDDRRVFLTFKL